MIELDESLLLKWRIDPNVVKEATIYKKHEWALGVTSPLVIMVLRALWFHYSDEERSNCLENIYEVLGGADVITVADSDFENAKKIYTPPTETLDGYARFNYTKDFLYGEYQIGIISDRVFYGYDTLTPKLKEIYTLGGYYFPETPEWIITPAGYDILFETSRENVRFFERD